MTKDLMVKWLETRRLNAINKSPPAPQLVNTKIKYKKELSIHVYPRITAEHYIN
jgi:hypothetical protein